MSPSLLLAARFARARCHALPPCSHDKSEPPQRLRPRRARCYFQDMERWRVPPGAAPMDCRSAARCGATVACRAIWQAEAVTAKIGGAAMRLMSCLSRYHRSPAQST